MRLIDWVTRSGRVLFFLMLVVCAPRIGLAQQLTLTWDPSTSSNAAGYMVYVGTSSGVYASTYNVGANRSFILTNAQAGQTYYFAVGTYNADGAVGSLSGEVSGATGTASSTPPPSTASTESTTPVPPSGGDTLTLLWDRSASPDVVGYRVRVGTTSGNYPTSFDAGNTTSFVIPGLAPGQRYYFSVNAYAPGPVHGGSAEVSGFSNAMPVLTNPGNQASISGTAVALQLVAADPAGSPLTYSATGLPPGLSIASSTGRIAGTPTTAGSYSVTARASDGVLVDSETFAWNVATSNGAPVMTNPGGRTSMVGNAVTVQLVAVDPNGTALAFTATGLPPGLTMTSAGLITGAPTTAGSYGVTARASDGALYDTETFNWTVTASNGAPALTNPGSQSSIAGTGVSLQLIANDPNGSPLNFLATGLPAGLRISTAGLVSGTPTTAGTYRVTATVSDGALVDVEVFSWNVTSAPTTDTQPPNVRITVPTTASTYRTKESFVTLGGTATDDTEVVEVTWVNDRGGSGRATGTYSWIATVPLRRGAPWNVITVTARDSAGRTSRRTIFVAWK